MSSALEKIRNDPHGTAARLLEAAEQVFGDVGFAAASTRQIAKRARIPFGVLHYHWGSKRRLYRAACERMAERARETFNRRFAPASTLEEVLDAVTDSFVDMLFTNRNHARLLCRNIVDGPSGDPYAHKLTMDLVESATGAIQQLFPGTKIDTQLAIFLMSNACIAAVTDEYGQKAFLGKAAARSVPTRDRMRVGLRRLARAAFSTSA